MLLLNSDLLLKIPKDLFWSSQPLCFPKPWSRDFASTLKDKIRIKIIFPSKEQDQTSKAEILKREKKNAYAEER